MPLINCPECGSSVSDVALQCPNCGIQLKKSKGSLLIKSVVAFLGVSSAVAGLFQFYNVETFPVITGEFCLSDNKKSGRLVELINAISDKKDEILFFDEVRINYVCHEGNLSGSDYLTVEPMSYVLQDSGISVVTREDSDKKTTYRFNFDGLLDASISNVEMSEIEKSKYLLNYHEVAFDESTLKEFEKMWLFGMSGYNVFLSFDNSNQNQNQYSTFEGGIGEGTGDYINGPFQIKNRSGGEYVEYELSSPIIDSNSKKQIECTKKDWSSIEKLLLCPFL
jgi:hypothetical protein